MNLFNMWVRKNRIALIALASIIILGLTIVIVIRIRNSDSKILEELPDNIVTYVTKQVIDYPEDINIPPLIWETVYNAEESMSVVYGDGKEIKRFNGGNVEKIVDFSPEVKGILEPEPATDSIISHDIGIIYTMHSDQSCKYVADQIDKGYRLIRKVLTANYAEVYLKTPEDRIIRILVLSDKMLMAELKENIVLDNIDSYFN